MGEIQFDELKNRPEWYDFEHGNGDISKNSADELLEFIQINNLVGPPLQFQGFKSQFAILITYQTSMVLV